MGENDQKNLQAAYELQGRDANRALYKDWAETYDSDFAQRSGYRLPALLAHAFSVSGGVGPVIDVGCGTGLVADSLPPDLVIDGLDLSPEMIAQSRKKGRYRTLIEADLLARLPIETGVYQGVVSAGTFTHGHVGPDALPELLRILAPGAKAVLIANAAFYRKAGFDQAFQGFIDRGIISHIDVSEERIYDSAHAPDGHADATCLVLRFETLA
ncbi:MAG: methyltransferase domain-containing protein [Pseudomonadota bacterium]